MGLLSPLSPGRKAALDRSGWNCKDPTTETKQPKTSKRNEITDGIIIEDYRELTSHKQAILSVLANLTEVLFRLIECAGLQIYKLR